MKAKYISLIMAALAAATLLTSCRSGAQSQVQQAVAQTSMASSAGTNRTITEADAGAVAHTINDGEIQMAQLAIANASSQAVREYAQMMIADHTTANTNLERNGFGTARNPIVDVLNTQVKDQMSRLRSKSGADFDRDYIGSQVLMHELALNTIKDTLLPSAGTDDLKGTLNTMRTTVEMHLDHARRMQATLGR
jgi:putative membrane protein